MTKIEQLKCPACGASEVSQLSGINYQCDYCHSTFIVKEDNPFSKFSKGSGAFSNMSKEELLEKFNAAKIDPLVTTTVIKSTKLIGIVVGFVAIALIGVGVSVFLLVGNATKKSQSFFSDWQKPSVDNYNCLVGSKGAVVWLTLKTQTNKLDSVKYWLRLIDPVTKKTITEEQLGKPKAWKELFNQSKQFDNDFYVVNDTAYNISDEGGIQGFDLYTGKRLFGNEYFEKKFPALKDGITKVDKQYYRKRVKITTASGDDMIYNLESRKIFTDKEDEKANSEEKDFSENVYLGQNKKSQLYLCTIKRRSNEDYYISDSYVEQFRSRQSYMSSYIKDIKLLSDSVYAMAKPIENYNDKLLFFYASDFSKHAAGVLALVDKTGKFTWRNTDTTFKKIVKENTSDNLYVNYNLGKDLIVININNAGHQSVGVDLKTGKTQFVFNQSYSID
ncbi:MAG: hypothetical protein ABIP51_21460 [Bacteroidia bacterium]